FRSSIALGELGRLLRLSAQPEGVVRAGGTAQFHGSEYAVMANVDARGVSLRQGMTRITGINLDSAVSADPHRIDLSGLRLEAMGARFAGSASLEEMAQFRVAGNLSNFDIARFARGYDGIVSGPVQAQGNVKALSTLEARANLAIAPGPRGIPVSGRLNADYSGRGDTVVLNPSYIA